MQEGREHLIHSKAFDEHCVAAGYSKTNKANEDELERSRVTAEQAIVGLMEEAIRAAIILADNSEENTCQGKHLLMLEHNVKVFRGVLRPEKK